MEQFLRGFLPRVLPDQSFEVYPFQGKAHLLEQLPALMNGYSRWLPPTTKVFVLVDRDQNDCRALKKELDAISSAAGLKSKSPARRGQPFSVVHRIVIEELEAWYFGDWEAVCRAFPRVDRSVPRRAKYRDPDSIRDTWQAFERVLGKSGYFRSGLRKIEAARAIAPHIDPTRNVSRSFQVFYRAVAELGAG